MKTLLTSLFFITIISNISAAKYQYLQMMNPADISKLATNVQKGTNEIGFGFSELTNKRISIFTNINRYVARNFYLGVMPQIETNRSGSHAFFRPVFRFGYTIPIGRSRAIDISHLSGYSFDMKNNFDITFRDGLILAIMPAFKWQLSRQLLFILGFRYRYNGDDISASKPFLAPKVQATVGISVSFF